MANEQNLKPFTGADDPRRMNGKPKGTKHLSTWIQELLNDEEFETRVLDSKQGLLDYKGAPIKAIIGVAIHKSLHDSKTGAVWAEWLAKHGYGSKTVLETENPITLILERYGLGDAREVEGTKSRSSQDSA